MNTTRWCVLSVVALVLLKLVWHGYAWPPEGGWRAGVASALLPMLPLGAALAFRLRGALIYAGIGVWIGFCHGVMEAYAAPEQRLWACAEIMISLAFFAGIAMRARNFRRQRAGTTN
jgi:uncharacterized membrane protein